jgi:hypothetical protein
LNGDVSSQRIHLRPNWIGLLYSYGSVDMLWTRDFGLMLTLTAAGAGVSEIETLTSKSKGVSVGNEPGFMYTPGRNGWQPLNTETNRSNEIPKQQKIWAAG